ncbi:hypothetical protein T265_01290 [Opisthorchis viverrini]|uniref:PID domain-containing protein n=1 Tax=Opisthorchis viverrini TaxID=6198 RepID=A0A075AA17_OPIVI|nr:hypothetical protein T265_01290 [Opisthorchis viverrini]KER32600.1 hypothetical protein T265_01290 [Opisthorchis viverrini]
MNCYIRLSACVHGRTEWDSLQKSVNIIVVLSLWTISCFSTALVRFPPFFASCSADPFRGRAGVQPTLGLSGMNGIRRTFSFRKKKKKSESTDGSKPQQWLDDEAKIKEGSCSFQVRYLGNIEVYESRGMQVCEEAIKALRKSKVGFHCLVSHNSTCFFQKKPQKAILYVSGDALRVSDDVSQHLIVDQTIEKVSFCAPDRSHDKGFAYICRDGATRRWMCHAFLAVKDSGERLSHAVGCAFAICLEKKQKRERDALQLATSDDRSFTRIGSFRPASLAERLIDPQSAILIEPVASTGDNKSHSNASPPSTTAPSITGNAIVASPAVGAFRSPSPSGVTGAIPRPRPSPSILERQGSLRLFPKLQATSPFKRDLSLRLEQLPSNIQRLTRVTNGDVIPEEPSPDFEEPFIGSSPVSSTTRSMKALGQPTSTTSVPTFPTTNPIYFISQSQSVPLTGPVVTATSPISAHFPSVTTRSMKALGQPTSTTSVPTFPTTNPNYFISQSQPVPLTGPVVTATSPISAHSIAQLQTPSPDQSFPDPFSAAPFNPATIQQHQQTQQDSSWSNLEALSHLSISTNPVISSTQAQYTLTTSSMVAVPGCAPTSPFLGGPPIAAPMSTSFAPSAWPSNGTTMRLSTTQPPYNPIAPQFSSTDPYSGFAVNAYTAGFSAAPNSMSLTSWFPSTLPTSSWSTPLPSLLPPEPDRLADPFDVGWADRVTSTTSVTVAHKPGNPFLSDEPRLGESACFTSNGSSPTVSAPSLLS